MSTTELTCMFDRSAAIAMTSLPFPEGRVGLDESDQQRISDQKDPFEDGIAAFLSGRGHTAVPLPTSPGVRFTWLAFSGLRTALCLAYFRILHASSDTQYIIVIYPLVGVFKSLLF